MRTILLAAAFVAAALLALHVGAQTPQMGLPDVSVTAPITTTRPQPRDSMISKWRNEEDKFVEMPCGTTRLSAAAINARCLIGYRLTSGMGPTRGQTVAPCDTGLDVVIYTSGNLAGAEIHGMA